MMTNYYQPKIDILLRHCKLVNKVEESLYVLHNLRI